MPRKTFRNFLEDFATLGIEYLPQKGPKVSDDIQMVYQMGNVASATSRLAYDRPPESLGFGTSGFVTVAAGLNGVLEIDVQAANGIIVDECGVVETGGGTGGRAFTSWTDNAAITIAGATARPPGLRQTNPTSVSTVRTGTITNAVFLAVAGKMNHQAQVANNLMLLNFFVPNGRFLFLAFAVPGSNATLVIRWHELPAPE